MHVTPSYPPSPPFPPRGEGVSTSPIKGEGVLSYPCQRLEGGRMTDSVLMTRNTEAIVCSLRSKES
jgi:hypothetical protein